MSRYAASTSVSTMKSRQEIEHTLRRYGADQFVSGWDDDRNHALVGFRLNGRQIRIDLPLPDRSERRFTHTPTGLRRADRAREEAYEQAGRQCWRALALVIKAKLEAVESGISTLEREFLADVMLPSGQTLGEYMAPQLERAYAENRMPELLPGS